MKTYQRLGVMAVLSGFFFGSYLLIQRYGVVGEPVTLTLPGEASIPFVPLAFLIYVGCYLLPFFAFYLAKKRIQVIKISVAFALACLIHYVFFIFLPVRYELRPLLDLHMSDLMGRTIAFFYRLDKPLNCFPSLHVSIAFLCYFFIQRIKPKYGRAALIAAIAISLSTLLVKQHYILDVVAAFFVAYGLDYYLLRRRAPLLLPTFNRYHRHK